MDPKKLEMLLKITMVLLEMLILAQKAGLLVRGRASGEIRKQMAEKLVEAERILSEVKELVDGGS